MPYLSETVNTTHLIHRAGQGPSSWWRTCAICDMPGSFGKHGLRDLREVLPQIAKTGFDAVLLRPSDPDLTSLAGPLEKTIAAAHEVGLKAIIRVMAQPDDHILSPADSPPFVRLSDDPELVAARTRILLDLGADGVDLGRIDDAPERPDPDQRLRHFTDLVNLQLAEIADIESRIILTAEALSTNPRFFDVHVTEDWFHHLRDDALFGSPWSAPVLQERIKKTYAMHDPLGQAVAWKPSLGGVWSHSPKLRSFEPGSWEEGARSSRADAMVAFAASLPGAVYIPFRRAGGAVRVTSKNTLRVTFGDDPADTMRRGLTSSLLHLRRKYQLGQANLAFINGISWAHPGVSVQLAGPLLIVLNTSQSPIEVPAMHSPLVYSGGFLDESPAGSIVEPETCAWFLAGRPAPVDPGQRRGALR